MRKHSFVASLATVVTAALTLGVPAAPTHADTIAGIVAASGGTFDDNKNDFDILLTAVSTADLVGALDDAEANLTVFAPSDRAFINLARDLGYTGGDEAEAWSFLVDALTTLGGGDPVPVLTDVLLYHVVGEELDLVDVLLAGIFDQPIMTLLGATFQPDLFRLVDNEPDLRDPRLVLPLSDIAADNGVIHGISRVLIPIDLP